MTLYVRQQKYIKNRFLDSVGEGEGGMIWKNNTETLKHVYYHMWNRWSIQVWYMKQGTQSQCTGMTQGWDGERGGRGVQDGGYMYTDGWFMSMYGKNHYNIVK